MKHREWQFVFVGPVVKDHGIEGFINEMSRWQNVHFLGRKMVTELASYPQHFDVCIMPYRVDGYTNNIYPLKLHEFLASGRPTVSSGIRSLREFSNIVTVANGLDNWSETLAGILGAPPMCQRNIAERQMVAREHDWHNLVRSLARTICRGLRLGSVEEEFAKR
jgi:glycosyltransferase involved in cell wall biosynthesis